MRRARNEVKKYEQEIERLEGEIKQMDQQFSTAGFVPSQDDFDRYLFPATVGECAAIIERAQSAPARPHATAAEMRGGARR